MALYSSREVATMKGVSIRRIQFLAKVHGLGQKVGGRMVYSEAEAKELCKAKPVGNQIGSSRRKKAADYTRAEPHL